MCQEDNRSTAHVVTWFGDFHKGTHDAKEKKRNFQRIENTCDFRETPRISPPTVSVHLVF